MTYIRRGAIALTMALAISLAQAGAVEALGRQDKERIEYLREKAQAHYDAGEYQQALPVLKEVLALNPQDKRASRLMLIVQRQAIEPYCRAGATAFMQGDYQGAIGEWEKILKVNPSDARVQSLIEEALYVSDVGVMQRHLKLARQLAAEGDYAEAAAELRRLVELYPDNEQARQMLRQVEDTVVESYLALAGNYFGQELYEEAEGQLLILLEQFPDNRRASDMLKETQERILVKRVDTALKEAEDLVGLRRFIEAEGVLNRLLQEYPENERITIMLEWVKVKSVEVAVEEHIALADGLVRSGRYDEAEYEIGRLLEKYPENERAMKMLGWVRERKVMTEVEAGIAVAEGLAREGRFEEAIYELDKLRNRFPDNPRVADMRAWVNDRIAEGERDRALRLAGDLAREGRYEEAIGEMARLLERHPGDELAVKMLDDLNLKLIDSYIGVAVRLMNQGRYEEATAEIGRILDKYPENQYAISTLTELEARVVELKISNLYEQATAFEDSGDYKGAIAKWLEIVKLDPSQDLASRKISDVQKMQLDDDYKMAASLFRDGSYFGAREKYRAIIEANPTDAATKVMIEKLSGVVAITPQINEKGAVWDVVRRGIDNHVRPEGNPRVAVAALWYAAQRQPDNTAILALRDYIEREYASVMRQMETPVKDMNLVDQYLFAALNHIYDGRYDLAIQLCSLVSELEPQNVLALKRMGSAYYAMGRKDKAQEVWRKAQGLAPNDGELRQFIRSAQ